MTSLRRILYVEDEETIGKIAKLALQNLGGFIVELCDVPTQAIPKIIQFQPDLILLDVMLPGIDGTALLKLIQEKSELRNIPVIFITAKIQAHEIEFYKKLGALDVIAKPFYPRTLAAEIRNIWERHHGAAPDAP